MKENGRKEPKPSEIERNGGKIGKLKIPEQRAGATKNNNNFSFFSYLEVGQLADLILDPFGYKRTSKLIPSTQENSEIKERLEEKRSLAAKI